MADCCGVEAPPARGRRVRHISRRPTAGGGYAIDYAAGCNSHHPATLSRIPCYAAPASNRPEVMMHPDVIETSKPTNSQLAGCYGKAAYPTKGAALHWSGMYAKKHWKSKGIQPYRCKHCSQWHMGRA